MRVALVFKRLSLHGGSERQVAMLARDLAARGHAVHVFCRQVRTEPPPDVVVHRMPPLPLGAWGELVVFSWWARRAVARVARRQGAFDVTHAYGRTLGQDVYRVGGGCHRTYLEHAHALDRPWGLQRILRRSPFQLWKAGLEQRALVGPPAPHVIANSRMVADDLGARYGLDDTRLHVVRNGVDLSRFRPATDVERAATRASWGLGAEHEVVLFLGTGYARKGLDAALRACARLAPQRPRLRLVVAGRDKRLRAWRRLASRLGLDGRVLWLGAVSDPERCYGAADVSVLPTTYDPAANGTLESLACGVPTVTSSMNGAAEVVDRGRCGSVLETPIEPDALAAAVARWLDDAERDSTSRAARARAERHPFGESCEAMLDVYRAVLQDRSSPRGARS